MTHSHDFDRLADAWMAEGPMDLADNVLFGALDEIHRTRHPGVGEAVKVGIRGHARRSRVDSRAGRRSASRAARIDTRA